MKRRHSCLLFFFWSAVLTFFSAFPVTGWGSGNDSVDSFLARYWSHPIAPQGQAPSYWTDHQQPLSPQTCGQCHPAQLSDWKTSRHGMSMGPGIIAQLLSYAANAASLNQSCLRCHAPLAEQSKSLAQALNKYKTEQVLETGLNDQGLICAGCHVRAYQWYGPPRRDGSFPGEEQARQFPHQAWTVSDAFEDSRFCSTCHQFPANGYALNGKLLENTYEEWRESRYARDGVSCQNCHMPDRRHTWRGIHDQDMVASGITVYASEPELDGSTVKANLTIENTGTGHYFPTYVTPRVVVAMSQHDINGEAISATGQEHIIARDVPLNLRSELFDTRIPPGQSATFKYSESLSAEATKLRIEVRVEPDAFYERFYTNRLQSEVQEPARSMYKQALQEARSSDFVVYENEVVLAPLAPVAITLPELIDIPAGRFVFGSDAEEREAAYQLDEAAYGHSTTREQGWYDREFKRTHRRTDNYSITKTTITNRQYHAFVQATGHRAPDVDEETWKSYGLVHPYSSTRRSAWVGGEPPAGREDHPVVLISHDDSKAYAAWLSQQTGQVWRLPTEVEWEKAARGADGQRFPWGDAFDASMLNSHDNGPFDTLPVASFPKGASPFGLMDAAGQVFEWTATLSNNKRRAVVKGGSWDDKGCGVCRPAARHSRPLDLKHILIGFRLVRE